MKIKIRNLIVIIVLIFIFLPVNLLAQDYISFKFGAIRANLRGDDISQYMSPKAGLALGSSLTYEMQPSLYLEFEFFYQENGYKNEFMTSSEDFFIDYYQFSPLFKISSERFLEIPDENIYVYANAGPNFALLVNQDKFDIDEMFDIGLIFGVGAGYKVDFGSFHVEARYNLGFVNIKEDKDRKNRAFLFLIGYSMRLK